MVNLYDFILDSSLFKKFRIDNLLFVEYTCFLNDPAGDIWSHNNYFAYVLGGKKMWKTPQNEYTVTHGESLFVKKGAATVYQYFEEKFYVLFVFIPDEFIRSVIRKNGINPEAVQSGSSDTVLPLRVDDILENYFQSLMLYFRQPVPPSTALLKTKLEELILTILSGPGNVDLKNYFRHVCSSTYISIRQIMEANFIKNLTLNEFARLCARSLSAFKRDFIKLYGISPGRWLLEKRLEHSRFLLAVTPKTIEEIIFESGFVNRSHFMKVFKEKFGLTPVRYRNSERIAEKEPVLF